MHLEPDPALGDDRADIAAADDAERLAGDLDPHEAVLLPFAGMGGGIGGRQLTGQCKHQRNRMFGRRDRIAERRVHHDDAFARGRRDIDIVDADAGTADDLQPVGGPDQLLRHLGRGADRQAVIIGDRRKQRLLVLAELGQVVDRHAAILKDLDGGRRQLVGYENAGRHDGLLQTVKRHGAGQR